jgi:hypothetical protein
LNNGLTTTLSTVSGLGNLTVVDGSALTATSINVDTLTIGGPAASAGLVVNTVPEPGTFVLLALAGLSLVGAYLRRR